MQKYFLNIALLLVSTVLVKKLLKKPKKVTITGFYEVPRNLPNRLDALHSFESRKSDGFGGRMATKINAALRDLYNQGINPDILNLEIKIDPNLFRVDWTATIGESKNGIPYVGVITRGSAGSGADERAIKQLPELKNKLNAAFVKDLNFKKGLRIRQFFYKYSLEQYPKI
jgi:hypothetical protein